MCTCQPPGAANPIDISNSSHSFICGSSAPCTITTIGLNRVGCVIPNANTCTTGQTTAQAACTNFSTCNYGGYSTPSLLPAANYILCEGVYVSQTSLPCPIAQRAKCGGPLTNGGYPCQPWSSIECCYCGSQERVDTTLYCSRTTRTWFSCVNDVDCGARLYCNYNLTTDFGSCGACRNSDNTGCNGQKVCVNGVCV
jgi:hypothetical protein